MCDVKKAKARAGKKRNDTSSVSLSVAEREKLNSYARQFGGKMQKQVLTLLIRWFLRQEESVRLAVLGWAPKDMAGQFAMVFKAMADDLTQSAPVTDPPLAHLLTEKKKPLAEPESGSTPPASTPAKPEEK
jgi:hypothetical protein